MYHPILRWFIPVVLLVAIAIVLVDHQRRAAAVRTHEHPVHHPRNHITAAGILALVLIVSFIGSFLIP